MNHYSIIRAVACHSAQLAANDALSADRADRPPVGYRLVDDGRYEIGPRDLVFVGGRNGAWRSARRAGEAGSFRRDSSAIAVAALAA